MHFALSLCPPVFLHFNLVTITANMNTCGVTSSLQSTLHISFNHHIPEVNTSIPTLQMKKLRQEQLRN